MRLRARFMVVARGPSRFFARFCPFLGAQNGPHTTIPSYKAQNTTPRTCTLPLTCIRTHSRSHGVVSRRFASALRLHPLRTPRARPIGRPNAPRWAVATSARRQAARVWMGGCQTGEMGGVEAQGGPHGAAARRLLAANRPGRAVQGGPRESSQRAQGACTRRGSGPDRTHGTHHACRAPQLRLLGHQRASRRRRSISWKEASARAKEGSARGAKERHMYRGERRSVMAQTRTWSGLRNVVALEAANSAERLPTMPLLMPFKAEGSDQAM